MWEQAAVARAEAEARQKAIVALDFVGLSGDANRIAGQLPYGDKRRLEIARALALKPANTKSIIRLVAAAAPAQAAAVEALAPQAP